MKKPLIILACLTSFAAFAADPLPPPAFNGKGVQPVKPARSAINASRVAVSDAEAAKRYRDAARLEPNAEDMRKAREKRQAQKRSHIDETVYVSKRSGTRIEELHDQNGKMTQVRVTPGETSIPYTMENQSNRPIQSGAGQNSRSTLGTPKFVTITW